MERALFSFSKLEVKEANLSRRGFIFACTNKSEKYILDQLIFATNRVYSYKIMAVKEGDALFLYNLDSDTLFGVFTPVGSAYYDPNTDLFSGKYPYLIKVQPAGEVKSVKNASKLFNLLGISWRDILNERGVKVLISALNGLEPKTSKDLVDKDYRPPLFSTTLWDYPRQSYGDSPKGNNKYPGVTPAFIIYNLLYRYTEPGDLVCDPMAGSGTTIDVCVEEKRRVIAFDIVPTRKDIIQADARCLPLKDETVDMIFVDSPYGDNIKYNDHPLNIGHIPATDERFYEELEKVMVECGRVLKEGKILAWLIGDQWAKGRFVPVGFKIYERLTKYFEPVDIVCVVRRNQSSNTPFWHSKAIEHNFYLRGFKYLIIVRKEKNRRKNTPKIKWKYYER